MFFLQNDTGHLRTVCDTYRSCVITVTTGPHPNFKTPRHLDFIEGIADILLTKGEHCTDAQMAHALHENSDTVGAFSRDIVVKYLERSLKDSDIIRLQASSHGGGGWSRSNSELSNGQVEDTYGFQASDQSPGWFWQRYWATGFNFPSPIGYLQQRGSSGGADATYSFPELTSKNVHLNPTEVTLVVSEAQALEKDLKTVDVKTSAAIQAFRKTAQKSLDSGGSLPPVPSMLHDLQQQRTALIVQHMVKLRTELGPSSSARLDDFIKREFSPHVSLRAVGHPKLNASLAK